MLENRKKIAVILFIILISGYKSLVFFKTNLNNFLLANKDCDLMCKSTIDIIDDSLSPLKKHLPRYKKIGFITNKCDPSSNDHWFKYRATRYLLYPSLLEDSADYDLVVGIFDKQPEFGPELKPKIIFNKGLILFQRGKNDF